MSSIGFDPKPPAQQDHSKNTDYQKSVHPWDKIPNLIEANVTTQKMLRIFQHTTNSWCHTSQLCIQGN